MTPKKLPYAPLQEVIFEGKWELSIDPHTKTFVDPEYPFALGKFQQSINSKFPVYKVKIPGGIPFQMLSHQPVHQFWSKDGIWPVIQYGPGVVTLNDTEKNYTWEDTFFPLAKDTLLNIKNAYSTELAFISYTLRYIDVVNIKNYKFTNWMDFVKENINVEFNNNFIPPGPLSQFNFEQTFEINEVGTLEISFSNGQDHKNEEIFIWQNAVSGKNALTCEELVSWLSKAHGFCSNISKEICKKDFYDSFISR